MNSSSGFLKDPKIGTIVFPDPEIGAVEPSQIKVVMARFGVRARVSTGTEGAAAVWAGFLDPLREVKGTVDKAELVETGDSGGKR